MSTDPLSLFDVEDDLDGDFRKSIVSVDEDNLSAADHSFNDESLQDQKGNLIPSAPKMDIPNLPDVPVPEFLLGLFKMLNDEANRPYIYWKDGSIAVTDPKGFELEVLHRYYNHSKFSSFMRQMNYFGFRKMSGGSRMAPCVFHHRHMHLSSPTSLFFVKRSKTSQMKEQERAKREKKMGELTAASMQKHIKDLQPTTSLQHDFKINFDQGAECGHQRIGSKGNEQVNETALPTRVSMFNHSFNASQMPAELLQFGMNIPNPSDFSNFYSSGAVRNMMFPSNLTDSTPPHQSYFSTNFSTEFNGTSNQSGNVNDNCMAPSSLLEFTPETQGLNRKCSAFILEGTNNTLPLASSTSTVRFSYAAHEGAVKNDISHSNHLGSTFFMADFNDGMVCQPGVFTSYESAQAPSSTFDYNQRDDLMGSLSAPAVAHGISDNNMVAMVSGTDSTTSMQKNEAQSMLGAFQQWYQAGGSY